MLTRFFSSRGTFAFWLGTATMLCGCGDNRTRPDRSFYDPPSPEPTCVPNLDGRFEAGELPFNGGDILSYVVSGTGEQPEVNIAGTQQDDVLVWDFSIDRSSDRRIDVAVTGIGNKWYADSFPAGELVVPFDTAAMTEAIYTFDDNALWLHGFASSQPDPTTGRTLIAYEEPVALYRFPFEADSQWTSTGVAQDATFNGLPYGTTDTYRVSVDAMGRVALPDLNFNDAYRMRLDVTIGGSLVPAFQLRRVLFFFECIGEVARITSVTDEAQADFNPAAETRRIGN